MCSHTEHHNMNLYMLLNKETKTNLFCLISAHTFDNNINIVPLTRHGSLAFV